MPYSPDLTAKLSGYGAGLKPSFISAVSLTMLVQAFSTLSETLPDVQQYMQEGHKGRASVSPFTWDGDGRNTPGLQAECPTTLRTPAGPVEGLQDGHEAR